MFEADDSSASEVQQVRDRLAGLADDADFLAGVAQEACKRPPDHPVSGHDQSPFVRDRTGRLTESPDTLGAAGVL